MPGQGVVWWLAQGALSIARLDILPGLIHLHAHPEKEISTSTSPGSLKITRKSRGSLAVAIIGSLVAVHKKKK